MPQNNISVHAPHLCTCHNVSRLYSSSAHPKPDMQILPFNSLNLPQTHKRVQSLHKPIRIYMGVIILGTNTLYINFCLLKEIPMASKGLIAQANICTYLVCRDPQLGVPACALPSCSREGLLGHWHRCSGPSTSPNTETAAQ